MATPDAPNPDPVPPSSNSPATPSAASPSKPAGPPKIRGRKLRIAKWCVRIIVGVPLLFALITLLLMRSPLVVWTLESQVRALTGCELRAAGAFIDLDGRLVMRDVSLRAPGVPGEAAEFLRARRAVLDLNWSRILSGDVRVGGVRLHEPVFSVSMALDTDTLNISNVVAQAQAGGAATSMGAITPPRIDVINGVLEFSEFDSVGKTTLLRKLDVAGSLTPVENPRRVYTIRMQETGKRGMILDGRIDLDTGASVIRLLNVALDNWTPEAVPTAARDIWRRLNIQGQVASTSLIYDKAEGPRLEVVVENVSMSIPIPAEDSADRKPHDLGLREVNGVVRLAPSGVRADLTGSLEGQIGRSRVRLQTTGLSLDSGLTCEIVGRRFVVARDPEFLPYIPATAREYFTFFSGPTGEIDARVVITRGEPVNGVPAEIRVTGGRLSLSRGSAAFHKFPYRFEDMNGYVEFDDKTIRIVNMTGRSESGAVLKASGIISPLTDDAMVDMTIDVSDVRVNQALLDAMPDEKRNVVETIFNQAEYDRLVAAGLIRAPGAAAPDAAAAQQPPEFALGGVCTVGIRVKRPEGADVDWITNIDVHFPRAGVVVEPFPLPAIAENLRVLVTDTDARLVSGTFRAIAGGSATVDAHVVFEENGVKVIQPDVRIAAKDVPIDAFLLHALPADVQPNASVTHDSEQLHVGNVLRDLHLSGVVDAVALITDHQPSLPPSPDDEDHDVDYDISVTLNRVRAAPTPDDHPALFALEDLAGQMRITRERFRIDHLDAILFRADRPVRTAADAQAARLQIALDAALEAAPAAERGRFDATINAQAIDLSAHIEQFVSIFSPAGAAKLATLRAERAPAGRLNVAATLTRAPGATVGPGVALRLDSARDVEFIALGGRIAVDWPAGVISLAIPGEPSDPMRTRFDNVRIGLTFDHRPCGQVVLDGFFTTDPVTGDVVAPADFIAQLDGWRFESPLNAPMLKSVAGATAAAKYAELEPVGAVDAVLAIGSDPALGSTVHPARISVTFAPHDLAFTYNRERIEMPTVSGRVTLNARGPDATGGVMTPPAKDAPAVSGVLEEVRAVSANWSFFGDGEWYASAPETGALLIDIDFTLEAAKLDPSLRALLPDGARAAIDAVDAAFHGPLSLHDGRVRTSIGAPGATDFTGLLRFADLSFSPGLDIEHVTGSVNLAVTDPGDGTPTRFRATAVAPVMRVLGVNISNVSAELVSGPSRGEILLTSLSANAHAGRLFGTARVVTPDHTASDAAGPPAPLQPSYSLELMLAGVRLAPVLADFAAAGAAPEGPVGPPDPFTEPDPRRGSIDAWISVSGVASQPRTRIGRGSIRIADGDVLSLPVIFPLIQLSNFQFPSGGRLGRVTSTFYIAGNTAFFDDISVNSSSIAILGAGTLNLTDLTLDMRFNSRSTRRLPFLSDLYEMLRNELITTTVTGPVSDPRIRSESLVGTRRMIDSMFTTPMRFAEMDLTSEAAARAERDRRSRDASLPPATIEPRRGS